MTRRPAPPGDWPLDQLFALAIVAIGWLLVTGGIVQATGARWVWLLSVGIMFMSAGGGYIALLVLKKRRGR